ncbi:methanethiol S-methyltransferase [Marilutibacter alkalisoli]|uniref:methanethiol S-methyltransferase n=1 Tax=Marilutibacter alkalisoli TaxID=2591633 RepID=A0A514BNI6_9GAMM|nr:methanethiol S-methyltransferase [Lysobacter alkalisoli]QDH68943.1 isoprenylcysteine carboxylmethyltransferase family protein [Lysobacter alkalisoli]
MKRTLILLYGVVSYAIFFASFLYAIGFVGNLFVPRSIDSAAVVPFGQALLVNLGLLAAFAVQHSVMARPAFKRWWTKFIPEAAERSTYVLFSSLALIALFVLWQPMGGVIWNVENTLAVGVIHVLYAFGWALVLVSTFLINHFDLFGVRQVWLEFRGKPYTPLKFDTPILYRWVRHPLYVGWLFAFWATPTMTVAHLVFALLTTGYILVAIQLEERDLMDAHPEYADYRREVPMLVPGIKRGSSARRALAR